MELDKWDQGIAQVFAQSGYTVPAHDASEKKQIHRAISSMTKQLTKRAEKGKLAHQTVEDITRRRVSSRFNGRRGSSLSD
ncbi:3-hydroxyacyl-CoA dehydrogenase NAD-binding domain-containing protein [Bacillus sp. SL00103]